MLLRSRGPKVVRIDSFPGYVWSGVRFREGAECLGAAPEPVDVPVRFSRAACSRRHERQQEASGGKRASADRRRTADSQATLGLHPDTVRGAVETDRFNRAKVVRASALIDPYLGFIRQTLEQYPRLRATRIYDMIRARSYEGSAVHVRRVVARLRPVHREAFLALRTFPGEQGQADWAHFGEVRVGGARRKLSCFVLVLSHCRALALEFSFDQTLENSLRGHVRAFGELGGIPRTILYDNLRSAVLERRGDAVHFHPRFLEMCAHYHCAPRPCRPARGNEKGRVERAIRYVRDSFFAARPFTTLADFNRQARRWRDEIAHQRRWLGDDSRTVAEAFEEERPRLLPLPSHPFDTDRMLAAHSDKII